MCQLMTWTKQSLVVSNFMEKSIDLQRVEHYLILVCSPLRLTLLSTRGESKISGKWVHMYKSVGGFSADSSHFP